MSLWDWALEAYGRPGVQQACLKLQDDHAQNVIFLLWAVWARAQDAALLRRAAEVAQGWEGAALSPLRQARRALRAPFPPVDDLAREGLREEVKAVELRAERTLMETLAKLGQGVQGEAPALDALQAASAAWGAPAPDEALAALAAALE